MSEIDEYSALLIEKGMSLDGSYPDGRAVCEMGYYPGVIQPRGHREARREDRSLVD